MITSWLVGHPWKEYKIELTILTKGDVKRKDLANCAIKVSRVPSPSHIDTSGMNEVTVSCWTSMQLGGLL